MNREQKNTYVNDLKTVIAANEGILVYHYEGITVKDLESLRTKMRESGAFLKITKNRITYAATGAASTWPTLLYTAPFPHRYVVYADWHVLRLHSRSNTSTALSGPSYTGTRDTATERENALAPVSSSGRPSEETCPTENK